MFLSAAAATLTALGGTCNLLKGPSERAQTLQHSWARLCTQVRSRQAATSL